MTIRQDPARAIAMWDFSWLERRWPGAGYEDWDTALAELADRGYESVRIDAYPHLVHADAHATWRLRPVWTQQVWGAPAMVSVQVLPALTDFIAAAARHGIDVGLSTWFRQDVDDLRMDIATPDDLAAAWIATLQAIDRAGLLDAISYVDLCNEFPHPVWAPFLYESGDPVLPASDPRIATWMNDSVAQVRSAYPHLDYTFSMAELVDDLRSADVSRLDLLEPHLWMAGVTDFYERVGYDFEMFDPVGYDNLVARGRSVYQAHQESYDAAILAEIDRAAQWSREVGKPLVTTECWSVVDYKDWPGLDWDWVKDLNERAVVHAAGTGRWVRLATSNFCGPQFVGMWRDVDHHRRMTDVIRRSGVDPALLVVR